MPPTLTKKERAQLSYLLIRDQIILEFTTGPKRNGLKLKQRERTHPIPERDPALKEGLDALRAKTS